MAGGCADWQCPPATTVFAADPGVARCVDTLVGIATHYDVLGVAPDAPASVIRSEYRARARRHHPDHAGRHTPRPDGGGATRAEINAAYRVLGDPGRRALYDRSLRSGDPTGSAPRPSTVAPDGDVEVEPPPPPPRPNPLSPDGPARFPWKLVLVLGLVGSGLVLVSAALADPPSEEVPDGVIKTDSCVAIEENGDAREIACTGVDDTVVELLLPTDAECPVGLEPHRDRLGLGIACIVP